ncbi:hypothetical protein B7494_g3259 [Chlorociboria aeruginascens]|nr:hypothetical protein B7494_g3259 [Chlorociboria aeruginascens]
MSTSIKAPSAVEGGTGTVPTPANNVDTDTAAQSRRESRNSGTLFFGLTNMKRNSGDAAGQARRDSFNDMKPEPGFIGKMWNKYIFLSSNAWT